MQQTDGPGDGRIKPKDVANKSTPLASVMDDSKRARFLQIVCEEWTRLYSSLDTWRKKMEKWERMSEMDYTDRVGVTDPNNPEPVLDVFSYQNDTLGMSEGFVDFVDAQASDDIFGTRPWLAAIPEGRNDPDLAKLITKHANYKLSYSDLETAILDGIRVACWGGTAFLKSRYHIRTESYLAEDKPAAYSKASGGAYQSPAGDFIYAAEELEAMEVDGADVEWKPQTREETQIVYHNTRTAVMDFKDIAFDSKAPALDLDFTPVYCRFRMGIQDVISTYNIPKEHWGDLEFATVGVSEEARVERGEDNTTLMGDDPFFLNQEISLVEGFRLCDPLGNGKLVRVHFVFSPHLQILFKLDFLANETPGGLLPVFPVRVGKIPRRVFGIGYFEKYENANNAVDRQLNAITYRNKVAANIVIGIHKEALANPQNNSFVFGDRQPVELGPDKTLKEFIEFGVVPSSENQSTELLNMHMQMPQMRSGITSAAQGELKGVPNASTATGVNQLTSRGALLLKKPIALMTADIQKLVEYNVNLVYANQNTDEVFTWGEGEAQELLTIVANNVRGLRMNVSLRLVQSQNQQKLQNATAGIDFITRYIQFPEIEKTAARALFVQAVESLGFQNAEDMLRQAVVDPAGLLALLPPDEAALMQAAMIQAGLIAPEMAPETAPGSPPAAASSAPVTGQG